LRFAKFAFTPLLFAAAAQASASYDANGIALGATEKAINERFPSAHCKPLEWASRAADRRCDDGRVKFAGVNARITFYLKDDRVQAFDVRFDGKDAEEVARFLKSRYGAPTSETREQVERRGPLRELYKLSWEKADERAILTAQQEKRRASLTVSRGDFEDEIYRVR
jgi:hypothetical protein